jgi:hypothetical protein
MESQACEIEGQNAAGMNEDRTSQLRMQMQTLAVDSWRSLAERTA